MWSMAYGVIALALLAFVTLYAALHTPHFTSVNLASELYIIKSTLNNTLDKFALTNKNGAPVGYVLHREGRFLTYDLHIYVNRCTYAVAPSGEPSVLYEITLRHSLHIMPWVETYAYVTTDGVLKRVEYVMVYDDDAKTTSLYVLAPLGTVIYIVDYPLKVPLACP